MCTFCRIWKNRWSTEFSCLSRLSSQERICSDSQGHQLYKPRLLPNLPSPPMPWRMRGNQEQANSLPNDLRGDRKFAVAQDIQRYREAHPGSYRKWRILHWESHWTHWLRLQCLWPVNQLVDCLTWTGKWKEKSNRLMIIRLIIITVWTAFS